jgi:GAF domain-containing protein
VTRAITSLENPASLLPRIAQTISDHLGFYHVGIFLSDEGREYGILSATNSEGGQRMLARGHRLKIGEVGIVGNVLQSGKPRIALDTGGDPFYFDNPDLPNTRSEMALPLRSGDQVIGALDVQSTDANAFSSDDIDILTILADEVSVTIQNSRLYESTRRSLVEAETIYRMYSDKAWARLLSETDIAGYQYNVTGVKSIEDPTILPEIQQTIDRGETYKNINVDQNTSELAVPIRLRGDTIGLFKILINGQNSWDEDQVDLVKSVSDRLALALENARLFEETSNRASRERTVTEITSKIRSTTDSQEMLQTAITELKQILNANEILILPYKQSQAADYKTEEIPPPDPAQ